MALKLYRLTKYVISNTIIIESKCVLFSSMPLLKICTVIITFYFILGEFPTNSSCAVERRRKWLSEFHLKGVSNRIICSVTVSIQQVLTLTETCKDFTFLFKRLFLKLHSWPPQETHILNVPNL